MIRCPFSAFDPKGFVPTGTTKFEKRGIAVNVPKWIPENCIMCNQCSFVCPHACIRPFVADDATLANAPETFVTKDAKIKGTELKYRMQISPLDCTGCGNCIAQCPAKTKALEWQPLEESLKTEEENWNFGVELDMPKEAINKGNVKGSQFCQPLFEFSGACAGCGETPYVKLATQLFGDRMLIANATGCSSIYGGSAPTCPYTTNKEGRGPAWANSLFEDNAEFGYGMAIALVQRRAKLKDNVKKALEGELCCDDVRQALSTWVENAKDPEITKECEAKLAELLPTAIEKASGEQKALLEGNL